MPAPGGRCRRRGHHGDGVLRRPVAPRRLVARSVDAPGASATTSRTDPLTGLLMPQRMEPHRGRRGCPRQPLPATGHGRASSSSMGSIASSRSLGVRPATGSCRPSPTRISRHARGADHVARLGPAASGSCCPRPTRSRRSTTSSASARPATCGSNRARSRCAWRSAGRARPAIDSLADAFDAAPASGCTRSCVATRGVATRHRRRRAPSVDDIEGAPSPGLNRRARTAAQSRPWRSPRPGVAPVCTPSSTTSVPSTMTCSIPIGKRSRLVVRGGRADGRRIEHDDVRHRPVPERRRGRAARAARPAPRSSCGSPPRG